MLLDAASRNIFLREDVNLVEKNYAAADYLVGLVQNSISKREYIYPKPLLHANESGLSSPLGVMIIDQVSARFAQLGYTVVLDKPDKPVLIDEIKRGSVLSGTYMPNNQEVQISLRLTSASSGQILGAFDYAIPLNSDIAELLESTPVAFKIQ